LNKSNSFQSNPRTNRNNRPLLNEACLRFPFLKVLKPDGTQEVYPARKALAVAESLELDLLVVSAQSNPPFCKMLDYGKYKFEQSKKNRDLNFKNRTLSRPPKELKLRPSTAIHDLETLVKSATKFLKKGQKVKIIVRFKAREITHPEIAKEKVDWIVEQIKSISKIELPVRMDSGKIMTVTLAPIS
jgi:translation initiation factor IF-3